MITDQHRTLVPFKDSIKLTPEEALHSFNEYRFWRLVPTMELVTKNDFRPGLSVILNYNHGQDQTLLTV